MTRMLARRFGAGARFDRPDHVLDLSARDHAGTKNTRDASRKGENSAFDADGARAAVKNQIDASAQPFADVLGRSRGKLREPIRARRGDRNLRRLKQRPRQRMRRNSQPDAREPGGNKVGYMGSLGNDDRKRSGPEAEREEFSLFGPFERQVAGHLDARDMDDQRARQRPALGFEDPADRRLVEGVRAQAVNRFGRKRHQAVRRAAVRPPCGSQSRASLNPRDRRLRPRSCRSCARPETRGSAVRDRHPARDPRRPPRAWCGGP